MRDRKLTVILNVCAHDALAHDLLHSLSPPGSIVPADPDPESDPPLALAKEEEEEAEEESVSCFRFLGSTVDGALAALGTAEAYIIRRSKARGSYVYSGLLFTMLHLRRFDSRAGRKPIMDKGKPRKI